ncbi:GNAT family N-acetyltransferase [Maritimibacter sp. UBA3975]|uniref:GNAT family N-acetyltransferase n=1 Tax=Maritimibacter sp. UBA3975 TaxID=1946833 RepID=UPI000C098829|nr:GNAT family N-acetyltransferase [Maritimibacter sp. UBA3975]MAM60106.1 GNAT family N-acetyltransferase [Maritimibacter sp.]|tara:strand:- start:13159 stop:13656 length:498 start_codon:yes stop_codon:yes gene_type:complete
MESAWGGKERCACIVLGDTTQITVRALTRADEPQWRRLWSEYLRFYESAVDEEVYLTTFSRLLSGDEPQHALIAEVGDRPVGLVHYLYHRHNWRIEDVCYLQDLYAEPEARGLGVGRALIEAVYAAADANNTPSVYWMTQEFNTTARTLYDRIGKLTPFIKYQRG